MTKFFLMSSVLLCGLAANALEIEVTAEQDVYTLVPPDNGSGPLWSFGCTSIARIGDDVYISEMQTGEGVPLLCNTRWRLLRRAPDGFKCLAEPEAYRQREPCSLAVAEGTLFMYVNDSITPPGTKYGPCKPHLLKFNLNDPVSYVKLMPKWAGAHTFTDHSYRGYAADPKSGRLLMLNIDAETGVENACMLDTNGQTLATGAIEFPIRACYPQVAIVADAVHVLAIGDIVEPIEEWRAFKFEKTQSQWDYVFRILYYAHTPNLREQDFAAPLEIANVDKTAGAISNKDLWIAPNGDAWILYTEQEVQSALMRDRFFPGKSLIPSLNLAVVRGNEIVSRRVILPATEDRYCGDARIHTNADGQPLIVAHLAGKTPGMFLLPLADETADWTPIPLKHPFGSFSLASTRAGNAPSNTIDILGHTRENMYSYAQLQIR